ncbi:MAG TPA: S41 family peptidase [Muribaculaceae bacterium]|nr:S41 family peptidase [Muribaculaceae bacterium]
MKRYTLTIAAGAILAGAVASIAADRKADISRNLDIFNSIYRELQTTYVDTIDANKSINTAINSMLNQIDPYTEYIPEDAQKDFRTISSGEYAGIGSLIVQRDNNVYISEPQPGSPALKAGLRPGDLIMVVNGDTTLGMSNEEVSKRLKGQPGTDVKVTVKRPYSADSILTFDITRANIPVNTLPYYGVVADEIGYIYLTTFNEKSAPAVRNALLELKKDPRVKSVVLDLRDNGGGLLESAVQIAGIFLPKGTEVVRYRGRDAMQEKVFKTTQQPVDTKIPLAVLINGNTASSSEIVAGALQDLDRAVIIGHRSFGKGLVQGTRPLPYNGLLKVTIAKYYIPSGRLIQAIDYSHRNADGTVSRIPDSLTNVYSTRAGREVRDGGGITPDIKVSYPDGNRLLYSLANGFWTFDYANRFAARTPSIAPAEEFTVSDSIFQDFKEFIDPEKLDYDKYCESGLKMLREATENEGYMNDSVSAKFDELQRLLKRDFDRDFDTNKADICEILGMEISERYYPGRGQILQRLRNDIDVDSAARVLKDTARYRELLSAPQKKK